VTFSFLVPSSTHRLKYDDWEEMFVLCRVGRKKLFLCFSTLAVGTVLVRQRIALKDSGLVDKLCTVFCRVCCQPIHSLATWRVFIRLWIVSEEWSRFSTFYVVGICCVFVGWRISCKNHTKPKPTTRTDSVAVCKMAMVFMCIVLFAYTGCALKPSDKNCS